MPNRRPVAKSKKKIRKLRTALKSAARDSYGPPMPYKSAKPRCARCGAAGSRSARHCTRCGAVLGLAVVKAAGDIALIAKLAAEPDPFVRQELYYSQHPELRAPWAPQDGGAA